MSEPYERVVRGPRWTDQTEQLIADALRAQWSTPSQDFIDDVTRVTLGALADAGLLVDELGAESPDVVDDELERAADEAADAREYLAGRESSVLGSDA